jgi:hypothetical protein
MATIFKDRRVDALAWLTTAAIVAVLCYWYPMAVARQNAAEDDRFGMVIVFGLFLC